MKSHYLVLAAAVLILGACEQKKSTGEKIQDKVNDGLDRRPGEKVRDVAEDSKDAVKELGKDIKETAKDAVK